MNPPVFPTDDALGVSFSNFLTLGCRSWKSWTKTLHSSLPHHFFTSASGISMVQISPFTCGRMTEEKHKMNQIYYPVCDLAVIHNELLKHRLHHLNHHVMEEKVENPQSRMYNFQNQQYLNLRLLGNLSVLDMMVNWATKNSSPKSQPCLRHSA